MGRSLPQLVVTQIGLGAVAGLASGGVTAVGLRATSARPVLRAGERLVAVAAACWPGSSPG